MLPISRAGEEEDGEVNRQVEMDTEIADLEYDNPINLERTFVELQAKGNVLFSASPNFKAIFGKKPGRFQNYCRTHLM